VISERIPQISLGIEIKHLPVWAGARVRVSDVLRADG